MAHINPLHPPVDPSQYSSFSTLCAAVTGNEIFQSPFRRRLPQSRYTPASKWRAATGSQQLLDPIRFDYNGYYNQGVPMREIGTKDTEGISQLIASANDQIFANLNPQQITLRILWPGYAHVEWARTIQWTASDPITRGILAACVAANFARFVEIAETEQGTDPENAIGVTSIQYEHLILVGLHNVLEDVWQADVAVDLR